MRAPPFGTSDLQAIWAVARAGAEDGPWRILVRPLEALDRTPVIDVKPVLGGAAER
jgi:tRNA (Thr-GGU) A37 N-methylase